MILRRANMWIALCIRMGASMCMDVCMVSSVVVLIAEAAELRSAHVVLWRCADTQEVCRQAHRLCQTRSPYSSRMGVLDLMIALHLTIAAVFKNRLPEKRSPSPEPDWSAEGLMHDEQMAIKEREKQIREACALCVDMRRGLRTDMR